MSWRRRSSPTDDPLRYAPGVGARVPVSQRPLRPLEWAVLAHVAIFLVGTTWAFGGMADWVRPILAWWGSLGVLLTLTVVQDLEAWREGAMRPLFWLWPILVFNVLVFVAALNPSFREVKYGAETLLVNSGAQVGWPSSARPGLALRELWLFDAIWISCFNLALVVRQRRALRGLLFVATVNAMVLAVFGTVQKLSHAKGLFFDTVESPQLFFFSSFVYHNHWGAFVVLMMAVCLGLIWHYGRRNESRDFFHSPAFGGLVVVLALAATAPLSTSRSSTALTVLLLGGAFLHWTARLVRKRRHFHESIALPITGALVALVLALAGVWFIAKESLQPRMAVTRQQLEQFVARGEVGARAELYRNTWQMAKDKLWFGWGMASYPHVFTLYQTRKSIDHLPVFYHDAHSDWLQAVAEHGFVGTTLLGLSGLVPLLRLRRRHFTSPLPAYLFVGCAMILLYAWIEFPFGNTAVVLVWWLCYFCAVHYARLQDREAQATTKIVSPAGPP